jgi:DegV family protein with EDD domain
MLAIVTDSTCDLRQDKLEHYKVHRVPLYINFKGSVHKDWIEISPQDIVEGVNAGAEMPSTSQPTPQDFKDSFQQAIDQGATEILCLTISSEMSGTYQSASIAKEDIDVPITVFDSRTASLGLGSMVMQAATMRNENKPLADIMKRLEYMRANDFLRFSVATLDFLKKNGRIGGASALLGSLLNIKPILMVEDGRVEAAGRARGSKKALREMVAQTKAYADKYPGQTLIMSFLHIMDEAALEPVKQGLKEAGIPFKDDGTFEIGAVIAAHVGPGTFGYYAYPEPKA